MRDVLCSVPESESKWPRQAGSTAAVPALSLKVVVAGHRMGSFFFVSFFFPCAGCTRFPNIGVLPASNHLPNHPLHPLSQALSPCALPPLAARAAGVVALSQKGHSVIIYRQMAQHQVPDPGLLGSSRSCSHLATHTQVAGWLVLQGVPLREGNASRQLFPSSVVFETL